MPRDRVVSVRLTEAEYAELKRQGRPSDILRQRLRPPLPTQPMNVTTSPIAAAHVVWWDGTVGQTWPGFR